MGRVTPPDPEAWLLARQLEDVAYDAWLHERSAQAGDARHDLAFSDVVELSPAQGRELDTRVRRVIAQVAREPSDHREVVVPTAVIVRVFPARRPDRGADPGPTGTG